MKSNMSRLSKMKHADIHIQSDTTDFRYDPKLHLRLELVPQDLYAKHTFRCVNRIFQLAMDYLGPTRYQPLIRQFPNAADIW
jgi:hypothetical protein